MIEFVPKPRGCQDLCTAKAHELDCALEYLAATIKDHL